MDGTRADAATENGVAEGTGRRRPRSGRGMVHLVVCVVALLVAGTVGFTVAGLQDDDPSPAGNDQPSRSFGPVIAGSTVVEAYEPAPAGPPVSLDIPRLAIDGAPVVPIPLQDGVLEPPPGTEEVGWWETGGRPGAGEGRAVLTGHTFSKTDGLFDDLGELSRGDRVSVHTPDGEVRYRVESVVDLSYEEVAQRAVEIFGQDGPERLVLVTCADFDGVRYHSNIIVTAAPV